MVCYRVIVAPYVRSVGHVFAYLYTLDDDSERPVDYETSLLTKVVHLHSLFQPHLVFRRQCKSQVSIQEVATPVIYLYPNGLSTDIYLYVIICVC